MGNNSKKQMWLEQKLQLWESDGDLLKGEVGGLDDELGHLLHFSSEHLNTPERTNFVASKKLSQGHNNQMSSLVPLAN